MANAINIPTAAQFMALTGRSGAGRVFKRRNDLEPIVDALKTYDQYRSFSGDAALKMLRAIRRACIAWLTANDGAGRKSETAVRDLLALVQARYIGVCELRFAGAEPGQDFTREQAMAARPRLQRGIIGSELTEEQAFEAARKVHWGGLGAGDVVNRAYGTYKQKGGKLSTGAFAKHVLLPNAEDDPSGKYLGNSAFERMHERILQGVKYCDAEERKAYRLSVRGGRLHDAAGDLYDTSSRSTEASGAGWAIFVLGLDTELYSNSHQLDLFHHSSFFSGEAVACGGELCVINGQLRYITAKTGHYRSKFPEFVKALRYFHQRGVDLAKVLACPDPHNDKQFYRASDVFTQRGDTSGGAAPRLAAGGHRGAVAAGAALTPLLDHFPAKTTQAPHVPEWPSSMG